MLDQKPDTNMHTYTLTNTHTHKHTYAHTHRVCLSRYGREGGEGGVMIWVKW